jgi:transcriptional regulator with XRE-family HTH domain
MAYVITAGRKTAAITKDEREFFIALGSRIAALRRENHITQVQLADTLGVAQSTINAYELGQRRVPASALPVLARALGTGLGELLGKSSAAAKKRGPASKLAQHMERIGQLPKPQQRFVMQVLESVLAQQGR